MYGTKSCIMTQAGKPVKGKNFIGREKEIALLMEYMKMGQSVVLIAPRRFGKTSLILEVLQRLKKQGYYTAFIDVFTNPGIDLLSLSITGEVLKNHKLHKQFYKAKNNVLDMLRNVQLKAVIDNFEFIAGFPEKKISNWELIAESIDFVDAFSAMHNNEMICVYDEFGDIGKYDRKDELVKLFRSKIQHHENSAYIFSGSYESVMEEMFVDKNSPFFRLARVMHLSYLERKPLLEYLKKRFKKQGIILPAGFVEAIADITHCHPYYAQLAYQQTILLNALNGKPPTINELLCQILSVDKAYLEKVWEDISKRKDYVIAIKALAESSENIYGRLKEYNINIARALKELEGNGMVFRDSDNQPYMADPIFKLWVKNNIR